MLNTQSEICVSSNESLSLLLSGAESDSVFKLLCFLSFSESFKVLPPGAFDPPTQSTIKSLPRSPITHARLDRETAIQGQKVTANC